MKQLTQAIVCLLLAAPHLSSAQSTARPETIRKSLTTFRAFALQREHGHSRRMTLQERKARGIILHPLVLSPFPWSNALAFVAADAEAMKGWTVLTHGGTLGGPSVFRMSDGTAHIMVRAQDGAFYLSDINGSNPGGPTDSNSWNKMPIVSTSDAQCDGGQDSALCGYLGQNGQAMLALLERDASGQYTSTYTDTGGSNAGAPPSLSPLWVNMVASLSDVLGFGSAAEYQWNLSRQFVWDGKTTLWIREINTRQAIDPPNSPVEDLSAPGSIFSDNVEPGWHKSRISNAAPVSCDADNCALAYGNAVAYYHQDYLFTPNVILAPMLSPNVPGGPTIATAPVLLRTKSNISVTVVRNKQGRLYWRTNGDWTAEGGAATEKSEISCLVDNEWPVCFIQGPDKRIYWKKFGTSAGFY